ncbi:MAG: DpnI domain-containing protein [Methylobacter sp.]
MNLQLDLNLLGKYTSNSQIARVLTENWVKKNSYCPVCGFAVLSEFENNKPVADFYCKNCSEEYELKSKNGNKLGNKISDGAYSTMIERINSDNNPNFFFLNYSKVKLSVNNFLIIPKHFFVPEIIEKRKPLSDTSRRAGWIGCNIDISKIPESGRIFLINNSEVISQKKVQEKWLNTEFLKSKNMNARCWLLDIMSCLDKIKNDAFSLQEIYKFEAELKLKHPKNNHIKDKMRQQLQILRDKGLIEFLGQGMYKKI